MSSDEKRLRAMRDAAPELYEVLDSIRTWDSLYESLPDSIVKEMREAFAKARGEASA